MEIEEREIRADKYLNSLKNIKFCKKTVQSPTFYDNDWIFYDFLNI